MKPANARRLRQLFDEKKTADIRCLLTRTFELPYARTDHFLKLCVTQNYPQLIPVFAPLIQVANTPTRALIRAMTLAARTNSYRMVDLLLTHFSEKINWCEVIISLVKKRYLRALEYIVPNRCHLDFSTVTGHLALKLYAAMGRLIELANLHQWANDDYSGYWNMCHYLFHHGFVYPVEYNHLIHSIYTIPPPYQSIHREFYLKSKYVQQLRVELSAVILPQLTAIMMEYLDY